MKRDPLSQLNVRAAGGHGILFIAGEVQSAADFDVASVAKRVCASNGVQSPVEPFIAFEPLAPAWAPPVGSREPIGVFGYATGETESRLPRAAHLAREVACELEARRTQDPEWFWLGSDFDVTVDDAAQKSLIIVRAEHLDSYALSSVRERITAVLRGRVGDLEYRVNIAGEEVSAGLGMRMGSSGVASSVDQYGSTLPASTNGIGRHAAHPSNAGAWIARQIARELVNAGQGKAVMIHAAWLPTESRPYFVRIRNERGADLAPLVDPTRFDLGRIPTDFSDASLVTTYVRSTFDQGVGLPWEIDRGSEVGYTETTKL